MAWVKFTSNFDWRVGNTGRTIAYEKDMVKNVTHACADRAVTAGRAVRMVKLHRHAEPVEMTSGRA